jgi:hypothetical protein
LQSFLLLLRSSLSSHVAVVSNLLLSGVHNKCQSLRSLPFLQFFCLINIDQSYVLSVSVCSGVAFQPTFCVVSLKNLTAVSVSSVLSETFDVNLSLMRYLKSSQFVCLLLKLGCFAWFSLCAGSMNKTSE